MERRTFGGELRAEGRRLSGDVLVFGDVSPTHRERFEPGSIHLAAAVHLDLHHDREKAVAWHPGGGLTLEIDDRAMTMRAEVPPIPAGDRALAEVRAGRAKGLSLEFHALQEKREAGVRVVTAARVEGVGIVRAPSYESSRVEARARSGRTMRAELPSNRRMACECLGKDACGVEFPDDVLEAGLEEAFGRHARGEGDLIAVAGDYARAIGSVSRGTVRRTGNVVEIDLPDTDGARALLGAHEAAGVIIRPVIDKANSEFDAIDGLAKFAKLRIRALVIGSTDATAGWPEPDLIPTPGMDRRAAPAHRERARKRWWL